MKFFIYVNTPERIELIEDTPLMPTLRTNDSFIMKKILEAGVRDDHLQILNNYIRMKIKAVTLADITTPNGKKITFDAWNIISSNNLRSDYEWPRDPPDITENQKNIWRNALHKTFGVPHSGNLCRDIRTSNQLGAWTNASLIDKWIYHYSIEESRVYKREGSTRKAFLSTPRAKLKKQKICSR